jgi:hypothetical protein
MSILVTFLMGTPFRLFLFFMLFWGKNKLGQLNRGHGPPLFQYALPLHSAQADLIGQLIFVDVGGSTQ